jgi:two-component system, OmpR family, phosphate regulon response regulator PhoB
MATRSVEDHRMPDRILLVEDEEALLLLLRYNLEAEGYAVDIAAQGDEAVLKINEHLPDLVLLD